MNYFDLGYSPDRPSKDGITFKGGYAFVDSMTCSNFSTPQEAPYSYGVHIINGPIKVFGYDPDSSRSSDYDDRLRQHYRENWAAAEAANILPKSWSRWKSAPLKKISQFLSIVFGHEVECLQVLEGCNVSNGYPYQIFITQRV
jgi:hypothetical protein